MRAGSRVPGLLTRAGIPLIKYLFPAVFRIPETTEEGRRGEKKGEEERRREEKRGKESKERKGEKRREKKEEEQGEEQREE